MAFVGNFPFLGNSAREEFTVKVVSFEVMFCLEMVPVEGKMSLQGEWEGVESGESVDQRWG